MVTRIRITQWTREKKKIKMVPKKVSKDKKDGELSTDESRLECFSTNKIA